MKKPTFHAGGVIAPGKAAPLPLNGEFIVPKDSLLRQSVMLEFNPGDNPRMANFDPVCRYIVTSGDRDFLKDDAKGRRWRPFPKP